jgi:biotin carboxyl carrier protein
MQYRLKVDENVTCYDVDISGPDAIKIADGVRTINANYSTVSDNEIHIVVEGTGFNAFITGSSGEKNIVINGIAYCIQDADIAEQTRKSRKGAGGLPQEITPPMPSVVERIMVAVGDKVEKGDGVVVVAAMKMETTLIAPFNGRVAKINVAAGDKVMPGMILVDIEKLQEESSHQADS